MEPEDSIGIIKKFEKGEKKFVVDFWPTVLILKEEFEKRGLKVKVYGRKPWTVEVF